MMMMADDDNDDDNHNDNNDNDDDDDHDYNKDNHKDNQEDGHKDNHDPKDDQNYTFFISVLVSMDLKMFSRYLYEGFFNFLVCLLLETKYANESSLLFDSVSPYYIRIVPK